jgi:hypothetical protein
VVAPSIALLAKIVLAVWGLFHIGHMNFRINFSISVKNDIGIFMGIALNL